MVGKWGGVPPTHTPSGFFPTTWETMFSSPPSFWSEREPRRIFLLQWLNYSQASRLSRWLTSASAELEEAPPPPEFLLKHFSLWGELYGVLKFEFPDQQDRMSSYTFRYHISQKCGFVFTRVVSGRFYDWIKASARESFLSTFFCFWWGELCDLF